jgi:uncharacterized protein YoxC
MMNEELIDRLCSKEKEIMVIAQQVQHIADRVHSQNDLARDVQTLVIQMQGIKDDVNEVKAGLAAINARPAETLKWYRSVVGGAVITAVLAVVFKAIGLI